MGLKLDFFAKNVLLLNVTLIVEFVLQRTVNVQPLDVELDNPPRAAFIYLDGMRFGQFFPRFSDLLGFFIGTYRIGMGAHMYLNMKLIGFVPH